MALPPYFSVHNQRATDANPPIVILVVGNIAYRMTVEQAEDLSVDLRQQASRARGTHPETGTSLR